jgi:hypothetical protein
MDVRPRTSPEVLGTSPSGRWLGASPSADSRLTPGAELARSLSEGVVNRVPPKYIQEVRGRVTEACSEIIGIGARIRPLMVDGTQRGWVRGFFNTERRILLRWVPDPLDFVYRCLLLSTSLAEEEVTALSSLEVVRLVRLVTAMGERDSSLYPYLSAFSTTRDSECLWHSGGQYASFENRRVAMPDGKHISILCPSDHARLWASLCTYREQAKKRLDENWNAVLIIRPWAGKSVDGLVAELKGVTKQMKADALEPWEGIVSAPPDKSLDDGWAHIENMETKEGMLRELHGMLSNDRHEQLMAEFERQQIEAAEQRKRQLERIAAGRGGPGINREVIRVETEVGAFKKERELRKGRIAPPPVADRYAADRSTGTDIGERIKRYQQ